MDASINNGMTGDRMGLITIGSTFTLLGCVTIALRGLVTILRDRKPGFDDLTILLAFMCAFGCSVAASIEIYYGAGKHYTEVLPAWMAKAHHSGYAFEILYAFGLFFVKISILSIYLRIASAIDVKFRRTIWTMITLLGIYLLATCVVSGVQCIPAEKYWNPSIPGHCINRIAMYYATSAFFIITDCVILGMPIPTIWKLHMSTERKLGILAMFLVGGLCTMVACVRLLAIYHYSTGLDPLHNSAPLITWSLVEVYLGIICACIPAIKPLFSKKKATTQHCEPRQALPRRVAWDGDVTVTKTFAVTVSDI